MTMLAPALTAFFIFLLGYFAFIGVILWHLHTYRIPGEPHHRLLYILVPLILVLALLAIVAFFQVPWNSFTLTP